MDFYLASVASNLIERTPYTSDGPLIFIFIVVLIIWYFWMIYVQVMWHLNKQTRHPILFSIFWLVFLPIIIIISLRIKFSSKPSGYKLSDLEYKFLKWFFNG